MIKVGSDFTGVGAFDQALKRLKIPYKTVFACDMDKYARETYIENYGEPDYFPENVYDREIPSEPLDVYMTSPPCQAFSLSGKRKGEKDKRGVLFYNSHEFIQENKPKFFIFENVKGLLSDDGGKTFQRWLDYLGGKTVNGNPVIFPHPESVPYHIYWKVLNAKDYGVPQNRERVFIIGICDDADNNFSFPKPFHLKKRLKDVIDLEVDKKYYLSEKMMKWLFSHSENSKQKGNGFSFNLKNPEDVASCINARVFKMGVDDNYIAVNSGNKAGYEIAEFGDSINLSVPSSETRRGRVGKQVAQTLDTACNQAIFIGKEVRTEESKEKRRKTGTNDFRGKEVEFRESDVMNTIQTGLTNDNTILIHNVHGGFGESEPRIFKDYSPTIRTAKCGGHIPSVVQMNPSQNNLFNDFNNIIFNGKLLNENQKRNTFEILFALQKEIGEKEIKTWGLRILETIQQKEILQQGMHEKSVSRKTQKATIRNINKIQPSKGNKENAQIIMRSLPKEKWQGCSPQRRKSIKQCVRKLNESLQKLPHENSQTEINLQSGKLPNQSEGFRILREALSAFQKIWESTNSKEESIQQSYTIRRLTPREAFRLQDFPETFQWPVSDSQAYKQAGNSIVVAVLAALIEKLPLK
jgi:DNA (cytosine-5)-methyltransferase 1